MMNLKREESHQLVKQYLNGSEAAFKFLLSLCNGI